MNILKLNIFNMGIEFNINFIDKSKPNPRSSGDFYSDLGRDIDGETSPKSFLEDRLVPFLDDYLETQEGDLETKIGKNYEKFNDVLIVLGSLKLNELQKAKDYIDLRISQESSKDDKLQLMKVLGAINETLHSKALSLGETSNLLENEMNKEKMIGDYFIKDAVFREKRYVIGRGKKDFILSLSNEPQLFFENHMENRGYIKLSFLDDYTKKEISYELEFILVEGEAKFQTINSAKLKSIQKAGRNTFKYTFEVWRGNIDLYLRAKRGRGRRHHKDRGNHYRR